MKYPKHGWLLGRQNSTVAKSHNFWDKITLASHRRAHRSAKRQNKIMMREQRKSSGRKFW